MKKRIISIAYASIGTPLVSCDSIDLIDGIKKCEASSDSFCRYNISQRISKLTEFDKPKSKYHK